MSTFWDHISTVCVLQPSTVIHLRRCWEGDVLNQQVWKWTPEDRGKNTGCDLNKLLFIAIFTSEHARWWVAVLPISCSLKRYSLCIYLVNNTGSMLSKFQKRLNQPELSTFWKCDCGPFGQSQFHIVLLLIKIKCEWTTKQMSGLFS